MPIFSLLFICPWAIHFYVPLPSFPKCIMLYRFYHPGGCFSLCYSYEKMVLLRHFQLNTGKIEHKKAGVQVSKSPVHRPSFFMIQTPRSQAFLLQSPVLCWRELTSTLSLESGGEITTSRSLFPLAAHAGVNRSTVEDSRNA